MSPGEPVSERIRGWRRPIVLAIIAGFACVSGSYLIVGREPAWVVTPFDAFVLAVSPDALIRLAITVLGPFGHQLAFLTAIGLAGVVLGATALPGILALLDHRWLAGLVLATVLPGMAVVALTSAVGSALGGATGTGLVAMVVGLLAWTPAPGGRPTASVRREVLGALGTAVGIGTLGVLLRGAGSDFSQPRESIAIPEDARPAVRDLLTTAADRSLDVDGLEPLVSTEFYNVDISNMDPSVPTAEWSLAVTGDVESPVEFDFEDLSALPSEDRFVTLRCVGDDLNGSQLDNALWTGAPVERILESADPAGGYVVLHGADGYYNEFPIEALWPGLLAYEMNGRPLPRSHGAPARALVPGHWGEINVKWLTEIEVSDEPVAGYWEQRGWHGTGPVNTVAKLHQTNYPAAGRVEIGGHAYAGTRGIRAVEVSTDGGETWADATLSAALPGNDVWRQWRYAYEASQPHEAVVRAVDGTGTVQPSERSGAFPSGASGWVSRRIDPRRA